MLKIWLIVHNFMLMPMGKLIASYWLLWTPLCCAYLRLLFCSADVEPLSGAGGEILGYFQYDYLLYLSTLELKLFLQSIHSTKVKFRVMFISRRFTSPSPNTWTSTATTGWQLNEREEMKWAFYIWEATHTWEQNHVCLSFGTISCICDGLCFFRN